MLYSGMMRNRRPGPRPTLSYRIVLALGACLAGLPAAATLTGTVTWDGHPVAGARVTVAAVGQRVMTDSAGHYSLPMTTGLVSRGANPRSASFRAPVTTDRRNPTVTFADAGSGRFRGDGRALSGEPLAAFPPNAAAKSAVAAAEIVIVARGYTMLKIPLTEGQIRADASLQRDYRRHLWVWEEGVLTNAALRDSLFAFGKSKGIGTYYVNAGGVLGSKDAALAAFLDTAEARGYAVELLFGEPGWATTAQHGTVLNLIKQTKALAAAQDKMLAAVPAAIQFDVEPYSMADTAGIGTQWVDMYVKAAAELRGTGVGLTACVPRWLDDRQVLRAGKTRPLSEWIADASDRMTLMDYTDKAKGILDGAANELAYADATGKQVAVGVETMANLDPPSVSFSEEGEAALEAALAADEPEFRKHPSYFGAAIHHWRAYQALMP